MRASVRCAGAVLASLTVLALPGCQPLNIEKTMTVSAGDAKFLEIDAPRNTQKVNVTVTAKAPVSAYLFLDKDRKKVEAAVWANKVTLDMLLGSDKDKSDIDFDATVPAKEPFTLYLTTKSNTQVEAHVKVVGR